MHILVVPWHNIEGINQIFQRNWNNSFRINQFNSIDWVSMLSSDQYQLEKIYFIVADANGRKNIYIKSGATMWCVVTRDQLIWCCNESFFPRKCFTELCNRISNKRLCVMCDVSCMSHEYKIRLSLVLHYSLLVHFAVWTRQNEHPERMYNKLYCS